MTEEAAAPILNSTDTNVALARYLHAQGYSLVLTATLTAAQSEADDLRAEVERLREALEKASHRLNAANVTFTAEGKGLAAQKFEQWANEAAQALAGQP